MTALMYAVKHGARDVIKILVKHKANLLITDAVSNQFYSSMYSNAFGLGMSSLVPWPFA